MPELKTEKLESALKKFPILRYIYQNLDQRKVELKNENPNAISMYRTIGRKSTNLWGVWLERNSIPESQLKKENYTGYRETGVRMLLAPHFQLLISTNYSSIEQVLKQYGLKSPFN